jgi:hypothetical protein
MNNHKNLYLKVFSNDQTFVATNYVLYILNKLTVSVILTTTSNQIMPYIF